jgi:hypothetical protein
MMVEFMQRETTVIPEVDCKTLMKLCRSIQNKRHGMLTSSVVLHDSMHPHTSAHKPAFQLEVVQAPSLQFWSHFDFTSISLPT